MSAPALDFDALLQPFDGDLPNGIDIREDRDPSSFYYTVKDARNNARAAERANRFDSNDNAEILELWKPVSNTANTILSTVGKDIEVCCWYIESLIRFHGYHGLSEGFQLLNGLIDQFWQGIYPLPDEDGIETTIAPITGLNGDGGEGTLLTPIRNCIIVPHDSDVAFTFWQYHQAKEASRIVDEDDKQKRFDTLGYKLEDIEQAIQNGPDDFYIQLIQSIENALSQFNELNSKLKQHCKHETPPSSNIKNLVEEVLRTLRFATKDKLAHLDDSPALPLAEDGSLTLSDKKSTPQVSTNLASVTEEIATREQALMLLKKAADFFRLYEPHTPIASTIDRAIKWGRLPVSQLMMELMPDDNARAMYSQLTGVKLDGTATDSYVTYNNNITPSTEPTSVEQIAPADNTITSPKTEDSSGAWSEPAADTASSGGW
jgi:type VI secretion system protein ImpA